MKWRGVLLASSLGILVKLELCDLGDKHIRNVSGSDTLLVRCSVCRCLKSDHWRGLEES
ncbi:hypothetical protein NOVOSPHI9U_10639 [Novosphingobium sp. 9U]|nr:hypothetical protein NOVOSPHI9U_10639 [Novosphingobium sp. 9U]